MFWDFALNPVVLAVLLLLILSALRLNVVFALVISSLFGGLLAKMSGVATMAAFSKGLEHGAQLAFNYAMLGAFSIAISRSGVTELLAKMLFKRLNKELTPGKLITFKYTLLGILTLAAISSQNLIPVHIAFIPVFIPPLLGVFRKINLDRRAVACILTFGLITPYMVMPFGFGRIYLNEILIGNINKFGLAATADMAPKAMFIPALGMIAGVLIAVFFSYRNPRVYKDLPVMASGDTEVEIKPLNVIAGVIAIIVALAGQLFLDSLIIAALGGIAVFVAARVITMRGTQDVFTQGVYLMGGIGIVMIAASGFAEVMKATGSVDTLVQLTADGIGDRRGLAIFIMLFIGLVITMGIGSSFSTVPLIAAIYVPLCIKLGISPLATVSIVGVAGALGDAGSPVSESVLGPTAGLNADGQHDHIYDSTIPTFIHFNIPLLIAGWIAGMVL
ncbi:MAG: TRAP transporter large permease subunit [Lentisphaerae bacterium]|nr:TRAP transporter large permease subunit [Lentisphaerota bacterium]